MRRYLGFPGIVVALSVAVFFAATGVESVAQKSARLPADPGERFAFVLHDSLTRSDVAHLTEALNDNYDRVKQLLGVASLPVITVQIWADEERYQMEMERTLGRRFPGSRGYVTGDRELRLLRHDRPSAPGEAVHEFAHVVSLNLNPDFGNNPRWLWEAVALYAANEFNDPNQLDYLVAGTYPSLDDLNAGFNTGKNIYDVGFLLIDYVVSAWSADAVAALVRANGDVETVLGVSVSEFESGWRDYVERRYMKR